MATLQLLRHATLRLTLGDTTLLVDPMLADPGEMPPIPNSPNDRRNPLVALPDAPLAHDALLVTHLHRDHLDDAARDRLPDGQPTLCQPADADELGDEGFDPRPVDDTATLGDLTVTRTPARHGHGDLAERMGPVSGFVLEAPGEPTVYHTGDTVPYEAVRETLDTHDPDVVVANAGAAQFVEGDPITMTPADVVTLREWTDATVVADHMGAINHCLATREDLTAALAEADAEERVLVPADGETVALPDA
jgi:L-ascorbate metabolism protein UlaG (beta-lactamase superfamily)